MEQQVNIVTTIEGMGVVEAKNDLAKFSLTVKEKNDTLETAKRQVEEKITQVLKDLKSKNMRLDGDISTSVSNYRLEHREGSEKYSAGFQSVGTITWTMFVDENINDVYKTCLKIDSHMQHPWFSIKDRESLVKEAIHKATDDVKYKLNKECSLLGVSPDALKIYNWHFGYEGYLPVNASVSNQYYNNGLPGVTGFGGTNYLTNNAVSSAPTVMKLGSIYQELLDTRALEPGMVSISVPVRVNYIWR
jgi:hypothetical protein